MAACGGYGNAAGGGPSAGSTTVPDGNAGGGSSSQLTVGIASPANGARVTVPFEVKLESNVPLGAPSTGEHHVHLYYDTRTPTGPYDLVYGKSFTVKDLKPGRHTILASLRNADHSDAGPRRIITVVVVGAGATPTNGSGAGGSNGGGYDYGGGY